MNKGFSYRNKGFIFANKSFILRFHRHKIKFDGGTFVRHLDRIAGDPDRQDPVPEIDLEREGLPRGRQLRVERQHAVADAHAPETLDHRKPRTRHRSDMAALADLAVVVVEVQARRAQVEFVGLVQIADTRGEDGVNAGRERRFVDRARLVEAEIAADGVDKAGSYHQQFNSSDP